MTSELEWRRRWKPDLRARPWKTFTIDDSIYLLKSKFFDNSYSILITDQTSVWFEELNEDDIKKRSKVWRIIFANWILVKLVQNVISNARSHHTQNVSLDFSRCGMCQYKKNVSESNVVSVL